MNHTPGPLEAIKISDGLWHIHRVDRTLGSVPIAVVDHHNDGHAPTREKAGHDAKLYAAAPPMYAVIKNWLAYLDRADNRECIVATEQSARALLTKLDAKEPAA